MNKNYNKHTVKYNIIVYYNITYNKYNITKSTGKLGFENLFNFCEINIKKCVYLHIT